MFNPLQQKYFPIYSLICKQTCDPADISVRNYTEHFWQVFRNGNHSAKRLSLHSAYIGHHSSAELYIPTKSFSHTAI